MSGRSGECWGRMSNDVELDFLDSELHRTADCGASERVRRSAVGALHGDSEGKDAYTITLEYLVTRATSGEATRLGAYSHSGGLSRISDVPLRRFRH